MSTIRFADFQRVAWTRRTRISFNDLAGAWQRFATFELGPLEAVRLVQPYVSSRLMEQVRAVVPLAAYFVAFKFLTLNLKENTYDVRSVRNDTSPCDEKTAPSRDRGLEMLIQHLQQANHDTTGIEIPR